jgi:hypothetical protein
LLNPGVAYAQEVPLSFVMNMNTWSQHQQQQQQQPLEKQSSLGSLGLRHRWWCRQLPHARYRCPPCQNFAGGMCRHSQVAPHVLTASRNMMDRRQPARHSCSCSACNVLQATAAASPQAAHLGVCEGIELVSFQH